jgi:epoxyqueuosine reductase
MTLTEALKAEAHRLGFSLAGVTTAEPPPHLDSYERWLAADRHGQMSWLASERARQRRADPRLILPECRSILVLGIRYAAATPAGGVAPGKGRVAAYAWGDDYHEVLPSRLQALVAFLEAQTGQPIPNRWYSDTGPLLERELAQRAGLGWIGKNTCLIHPRHGSYFLLAEILLGIALEPDPPFAFDRCGACTRCLEACPTACILPDRTIDARRCLSYLTIEEKGSLPAALRPQLQNWVFGCDICQQVCPWNGRFAGSAAGDPAFQARAGLPAPQLSVELGLDAPAFNRKFRGSPIRRSKRRGYLRNVAVALGNQHNPDTLPALIQALADPEALVRGHVAWALGRLGGAEARAALQRALASEQDEAARAEIQAALAV